MPAEPETLKARTLADGTLIVESQRGGVTLSRVAPGFVLFTCRGTLSELFYSPMVAVAQGELGTAGKLTMFVDGWELKSVETGFREAWTAWFKPNRDRFVMRLLVRTKLMEMAASLANLMTGMTVIKTYSNVSAWEAVCRGDQPAFRRAGAATGAL